MERRRDLENVDSSLERQNQQVDKGGDPDEPDEHEYDIRDHSADDSLHSDTSLRGLTILKSTVTPIIAMINIT